MEFYIPIEKVKAYNDCTQKATKLYTSTEDAFKSDDVILISEEQLLEIIEEQIDNQNVTNGFIKKLLKMVAYDENLQPAIISTGIDLSTKCTEDPEKAIFVAAKKMWASIGRGW